MLLKNRESISSIPISVYDRIEKLVENLEKDMDDKIEAVLREITISVGQVHDKFIKYVHAKGEEVPPEILVANQVASKLEVRNDGSVDVHLQAGWLRKLIIGLRWTAIAGGSYGSIEMLRHLLGV